MRDDQINYLVAMLQRFLYQYMVGEFMQHMEDHTVPGTVEEAMKVVDRIVEKVTIPTIEIWREDW